MKGIEKWNADTLLLNNFMPECKNKRIYYLLTT
jgi:hypothetical protein